jgi:hypothetical protein
VLLSHCVGLSEPVSGVPAIGVPATGVVESCFFLHVNNPIKRKKSPREDDDQWNNDSKQDQND